MHSSLEQPTAKRRSKVVRAVAAIQIVVCALLFVFVAGGTTGLLYAAAHVLAEPWMLAISLAPLIGVALASAALIGAGKRWHALAVGSMSVYFSLLVIAAAWILARASAYSHG